MSIRFCNWIFFCKGAEMQSFDQLRLLKNECIYANNLNLILNCLLFLNHCKKADCCLLAPIAVEILVCRGSAHKITTKSGTNLSEKRQFFCSKNNNRIDVNNKLLQLLRSAVIRPKHFLRGAIPNYRNSADSSR